MSKEQLEHALNEYWAQYGRPYRMTGATFEQVGNGWTCSHQGLVAHGETPAMAAENFDHLWTFGGPK